MITFEQENSSTLSSVGRCAIQAVALDFTRRLERVVAPCDLPAALGAEPFLWIDVGFHEITALGKLLGELALLPPEVREHVLESWPAGGADEWASAPSHLIRHEDCLQFTVCGCSPNAEGIAVERVDCLIGDHFMLTLHRRTAQVVEATRRAYRQDFLRFARSPSFLVYELWEQVIENYRTTQAWLEERVELLQVELMDESLDDRVFARVSTLGAALLHFRKLVMPARGMLSDLGTRRSLYLSETTQQLLTSLVGSAERVLSDLLVDRDILSESLDLYMSRVAHRTNQVMRRLTVVSVIFLPLTFLCGVYGMNFEHLPELKWEYGYAWFWLAVACIVVGIAWFSRRAKLL